MRSRRFLKANSLARSIARRSHNQSALTSTISVLQVAIQYSQLRTHAKRTRQLLHKGGGGEGIHRVRLSLVVVVACSPCVASQ